MFTALFTAKILRDFNARPNALFPGAGARAALRAVTLAGMLPHSAAGRPSLATAVASLFVQRIRSAKRLSSISIRPWYSAKFRSLWAFRKICMSDLSEPNV